MAIAFVQGGRDTGADRLEGAGAAAVQRCRQVEFLTDLHLAAPARCDVPDGPANEACEPRRVGTGLWYEATRSSMRPSPA